MRPYKKKKRLLMGEECTFLHDSISIPRAPRKVCFVVWLTARDAILTTENLRKWKINYVSWCFMCTSAGENVDHHLLLHCKVASQLWKVAFNLFGMQ